MSQVGAIISFYFCFQKNCVFALRYELYLTKYFWRILILFLDSLFIKNVAKAVADVFLIRRTQRSLLQQNISTKSHTTKCKNKIIQQNDTHKDEEQKNVTISRNNTSNSTVSRDRTYNVTISSNRARNVTIYSNITSNVTICSNRTVSVTIYSNRTCNITISHK